MASWLLVAAVAVRAAFPPFEVDGVPGRYAEALPNLFMSSVDRQGCAEGVGDTAIDEGVSVAINGCAGDPACVTKASSNLIVDFVVLGSLKREGSTFQMKLDVIDASRRTSAKRLEKSFDSLLNGVPGAISELSTSLCKVLQSQKPAVPAIVLAERRARKDGPPATPPPVAPPPKPVEPADDLSLDLPPLEAPPPPAPPPPPTPPPASTPPPQIAAAPVPRVEPTPAVVIPLPPPEPPKVVQPPPPPPKTVEPPTPPAIVGPMRPPTPPALVAPPPEPPPPTPEQQATVSVPPPVLTPPPPPVPGPSAGEVLRSLPWNWILIGAAAVSTGVGVYFGSQSQAIWGADHPTTVGGVTQHTISRVDAAQANKQAVNANISFAVGGALAAGGGVLFLVKF